MRSRIVKFTPNLTIHTLLLIVLVTGDTDLAPAVRIAQRLFPRNDIRFALPYERGTKSLRKIAPKSFRIGKDGYTKHQFPDPFIRKSGRRVAKPSDFLCRRDYFCNAGHALQLVRGGVLSLCRAR
jgi:hypothetical protein